MTLSGSKSPVAGHSGRVVMLLAAAALATADGCSRSPLPKAQREKRVIVIGMDGLDPNLLQGYIAKGELPNFQKLITSGTFKRLGTAMPPQSPVAWSNFISGGGPGTHQIYDFVHRRVDPKDQFAVVEPYSSIAEIRQTEKPWYARWLPDVINWGPDYEIPLAGQESVSLRKGPAFWDTLTANGVDCQIYRIPANYPPPPRKGPGELQCLCGMGTPDVNGTMGEYTFFLEGIDAPAFPDGGRVVPINLIDNHGTADFEGPPDFLHKPNSAGERPIMGVKLEFTRAANEDAVSIRIGDDLQILKAGEWSDWRSISFASGAPKGWMVNALGMPTAVPGMLRFYVKSVRPKLQVYVTPANIDPTNPANPISTPSSFADQLAEIAGRYYTTGIPEDTKALRNKPQALNEDEFLQMVHLLTAERAKQYEHVLETFDHGFLFFYFGHTDQLAHVFWRDQDPGHPGRDAAQGDRYAHVIEDTYREMDMHVGELMKRLRPDDTLLVVSDHGFSGFHYGFNVNTWLKDNGYLVLTERAQQAERDGSATRFDLADVDWRRTRAYAIGINSLFLNIEGRERRGIVKKAEVPALIREIGDKLMQVRDPNNTDTPVVVRMYYQDQEYPNGDPNIAPDALIGYNANYRGSWSTSLGGIPRSQLQVNTQRWSGDHCIADFLVPGVLITNQKVTVDDPKLSDMGPSILGLYGLPPAEKMQGRNVFGPAAQSLPAR